jgi:hypothetical protein
MATLDRVIEMQGQGLSEEQISSQLQNEGIAPKDISNSLNQAKIKNAVSPPEGMPAPAAPEAPGEQGMQPSIMQEAPQGAPIAPEQAPAPAPGQAPAQDIAMPAGQPNPEVYEPQPAQEGQPQDDYYTQSPQAYSDQGYYAPQGTTDTETISEIAEQVATEKLNEFKKKTGDIASFRNTIQDKVDDIDDRLKRIETSIDKLQQAVIGKIGEFGESNAMIHKDLDNLHGTVSKLMNPLIDNYNELKKIEK